MIKLSVVFPEILFLQHQLMKQRTLFHDFSLSGRINGIIHVFFRVILRIRHSQRIGPVGKIVIPRQHLDPSSLFIEKIIVSGTPQITVQIDNEHLYGEISQDLFHVHRLFQRFSFGKTFQRPDQCQLFSLRHLKPGFPEDILVAVRIIIHIAQGNVCIFILQTFIIRLVELSVIVPVVPVCKRILRFLHGQIQSPGTAVHRHPHIAGKRRRHSHMGHHVIGQIAFQIAVVLKRGIKRQLIQAVIALSRDIMIKLHLQAVAVPSVFFNELSGIVSFDTDPRLLTDLTVYDDGTGAVFLPGSLLQKTFPVLHLNVNRMHSAVVEQERCVFRMGRICLSRPFHTEDQKEDSQADTQNTHSAHASGSAHGLSLLSLSASCSAVFKRRITNHTTQYQW